MWREEGIFLIPPDKFPLPLLISSPPSTHNKGTPIQSPPDKGGKGGFISVPIYELEERGWRHYKINLYLKKCVEGSYLFYHYYNIYILN